MFQNFKISPVIVSYLGALIVPLLVSFFFFFSGPSGVFSPPPSGFHFSKFCLEVSTSLNAIRVQIWIVTVEGGDAAVHGDFCDPGVSYSFT